MRHVLGGLAAAIPLILFSVRPAAAEGTPTPTPAETSAPPACTRTPPPAAPACGSSRVRLNWAAKRPDVITLSISATHCAQPAACTAAPAFSSVTTAPATVEIADAACHAFSTVFTIPALNTTGCPGKDFYKGTTDKLRLIYGAETTALAFLRIPLLDAGVPTLTPPITFDIRDAAGYAIQGTLNTCLTTSSDSFLRLKCF